MVMAKKTRHSTRKIQDEFAGMKISRQRKYQLRHRRDKLCIKCNQPALAGSQVCRDHRIYEQERDRKK
jgi:hypothetical protein